MIRLDINYSNNLALWNDIRIIFATPGAILVMVAEAVLNKYRGHYKEQDIGQDIRLVEKSESV